MTATARSAFFLVGAAALAVAVGAGTATKPQVTFVATIAVLGITALAAPAGAWVICALIAALTFKGLVTLGVLPSVATFVDLPLSWGALFVALLKRRAHVPFLRRHLHWLSVLALAVLVAWLFNRSEVLRPVVDLMLIGEPFAVVGALVADPPSPRLRLLLERTLFTLVVIQIPFAAVEFAKYGFSDQVQGTLWGAGAGADVVSAVMVVGGIWILTGGIGRRSLRQWRLPIVAALFIFPFLADAKQVIVALPAIVLASSWRVGRLQLAIRSALAIGSVVALFTLDPAGHTAAWFIQQNEHGRSGKLASATFVWHKLDGDPASLVFGKGPAETVSRAAFMTTPLLQQQGSPLAILGLKPAIIPAEVQPAALAASGGGTSFNSGLSSALGVFGDLGVFGLFAYLGLVLSVLLRLRTLKSAEGVSAACGFALFLVLGLIFDWWEQPPLGVFLGVLAGLALTADSVIGRGHLDEPQARRAWREATSSTRS